MPPMAGAPPPAPPLREDLRLAAWLALACALATAAVFPYVLELMPEVRAKLTLPLAVVVPLQALQGGLVLGALGFIGLRMGPRTGLDAPWLRALVAGRPRPTVSWVRFLGIGALAGMAVVALALVTDPFLPPPRYTLPTPGAWAGLLASFYGAIGEEVLVRLFAMTLLAWVGARLLRRPPGTALMWLAIVAAALLFGAGHLPTAAGVWPLTAAVVLRTLVLNAVVGVAFGWLYWRRGLEAAICAHFGADLVLHVAMPLLAG